jgi:hypothetical protein
MPAAPDTRPLPTWLVWAGSAAIVFHLFALVIVALAAPSGPWPSPFGPSPQEPPAFAQEISRLSTRHYLRPLQLSSNYHFESNKTEYDSVYFEAQLRDANNNLIQTLRIPDEQANIWVRNKQIALAQSLGVDEPVQPPRGEIITPPGQEMPKVKIWDVPEGGGPLKLQEIPVIRIPREREVYRPSDLSLQLARSYSRHLCKQMNAASVELIRHSRRPVFPAFIMREEGAPPDAFEEMICSFGEYRLEK